MRFQKIELREVCIPFRFSFKHALADRKEARSVVVCLSSECGVHGWGECVPRDYLTGETVEGVLKSIRDIWWPQIREQEFILGTNPAEKLLPLFRQATEQSISASFAGIDIAVYDTVSRCGGKPLAELMKWEKPVIDLTAPLGGSSFQSVKKKARWFKFLGFKEFKIKLGMGKDKNVCAAASSILGEEFDLRADSNAAWNVQDALQNMSALKNFCISSFEQPVGTLEEMAELKKRLPFRIMADESLCTYADAHKSIDLKACDMWNLRLAKIGGFTGMQEFVKLAITNNISLHLGTLVGETSLLAAAGRAATGMAKFRHVEYGFPRIFLKGDPFRGGPAGYFGTGLPQCANPGLGVIVNQKALDKVTINKIVIN